MSGLFGLPPEHAPDEDTLDAVLLRGGPFDGLQVWLLGDKPVICPIHHLDVGAGIPKERRVAFVAENPDGCAGYERTRELEGRFTVYRPVAMPGLPATDLCRSLINLARLQRGLPEAWPTPKVKRRT